MNLYPILSPAACNEFSADSQKESCVRAVFNMLSENGLHESALRTAINTDEPSIGHWWKKWNATTVRNNRPAIPCESCASAGALVDFQLIGNRLSQCFEAFPNTNSPTNPSGTLNHIFCESRLTAAIPMDNPDCGCKLTRVRPVCGGIGHWMWRHLVGLTPAAPGFAEVRLAPKIHDRVGPKSVGGQFRSPKGVISSSWKQSAGTVSLSVGLPVGVGAATIVVPKPTTDGKPAAVAVVKLAGTVVWDGNKLVGKPGGIVSAVDQPEGVAFVTTNGAFDFESTAKSEWLAIL